jgi:hypothetical protein
MKEQLIELSVGPLDLATVHRFTPIEHVHEQACVVRGRLDGIREDLNLTLSEREKR